MSARALVVGCGAAKRSEAAPARDLYTGSLFRAAREHAEGSGLPWRILSAEYGLLTPDKVVEPYDRHMRTRHPFPMGPRDAVERRELRLGGGAGEPRRWVATGKTYRTSDGSTSWWWDALRSSLFRWLWVPKHPHWWAPDDCLGVPRGEHVEIEVHAGQLYVEAVKVAARHRPVSVIAPLEGQTLGRWLSWYARERRGPQLSLFGGAA